MARFKQGFLVRELLNGFFAHRFLSVAAEFRHHDFSAYTSLPGSRLNGGRLNDMVIEGKDVFDITYDRSARTRDQSKKTKRGTIDEVTDSFFGKIEIFNENGIPIDLALTNHFTDDTDIANDPLLKKYLDFMAEEGQKNGTRNGVVYVSDALRDFVREQYQDSLKLTTSVLKLYSEHPGFTYLMGLSEADNIVIMHNDDKVIRQIPPERREDAYLLLNTGCFANCLPESSNVHYVQFSKFNRGETDDIFRCGYDLIYHMPAGIDEERLKELMEEGFTSFKLGRYEIDEGLAPRIELIDRLAA